MGKGNFWANGILGLVFNGTAVAALAQNAASTPATTLYVSLHTADPGAAGNQATNEIAYTSYARVGVVRTSSGWSVVNEVCTPVGAINFPAGTGGSGTATYFGIGTASSGAGQLLYSGPISPNIVCGAGVTPSLTTATTISES